MPGSSDAGGANCRERTRHRRGTSRNLQYDSWRLYKSQNLTKISTRTGHARNRNAKDTETKPISTSDDDSNLNLGHSSVVHTGGSNLLRGSRNLRTHVRTHPCLVTTLD